jgi:hypothetical protein
MAGGRRRNVLVSKRRVDEEDGDGPRLEHDDDDLQSDVSLTDDDGAYASDTDDVKLQTEKPTADSQAKAKYPVAAGQAHGLLPERDHSLVIRTGSDTDMMLNGLKISPETMNVEEMTFKESTDLEARPKIEARPKNSSTISTKTSSEQAQTPSDRRRKEHDIYKAKRDADPAFVPNRGAFFMHDHRHAGPAANGFRPYGGRGGRGRGAFGTHQGRSRYGLHLPTNEEFSDIFSVMVCSKKAPIALGLMICTNRS